MKRFNNARYRGENITVELYNNSNNSNNQNNNNSKKNDKILSSPPLSVNNNSRSDNNNQNVINTNVVREWCILSNFKTYDDFHV